VDLYSINLSIDPEPLKTHSICSTCGKEFHTQLKRHSPECICKLKSTKLHRTPEFLSCVMRLHFSNLWRSHGLVLLVPTSQLLQNP